MSSGFVKLLHNLIAVLILLRPSGVVDNFLNEIAQNQKINSSMKRIEISHFIEFLLHTWASPMYFEYLSNNLLGQP